MSKQAAEGAFNRAVKAEQRFHGTSSIEEGGFESWLESKGRKYVGGKSTRPKAVAPDPNPPVEEEEKRDTREPKRVVKEKSMPGKADFIGLLTVCSTLSFSTVALLTGHDHWSLDEEESAYHAKALNGMLDTLPNKYYEIIVVAAEKWLPRFFYIFALCALVAPRINESAKRFDDRNYRSSEKPDSANREPESERASSSGANGFTADWTSLGGNYG